MRLRSIKMQKSVLYFLVLLKASASFAVKRIEVTLDLLFH